MRRVLATDLAIWPRLQNIHEVSDTMLASPACWARLANYILLYDQIVIPTGNLQILPVLRLILGETVFDELVRNRGIVLARYDQWFGYAGNGGGLASFVITADPSVPPSPHPNLALAFFAPLDKAIEDTLAATNPPSTAARRSEIARMLVDNVVVLPSQAMMGDALKQETYADIVGSPYLRDLFALRNAGRSKDALIGIRADQVAVCTPHDPPVDIAPEIASVLRAAFENLLLSIGGHVGATDVVGDDSTMTLLRAKGQRLGYAIEGAKAFAAIQQVSGVPDLGRAFAGRQLSAQQVLDLRYSKQCQALRDWFAEGAPGEKSDETLRRYVEALGRPSWLDSLPARILRFAITTAVGFVEPVSGIAISALDSFVLSKWFPGRSPRLFMKHAKVLLASSPVIPRPEMHGRDRNKPCPCGSGKKLKNCCGA